ncbi:uracil-DNA glycosylase [Halorubraceae archaeon YAN]|nr:uracil-DNA glycosylase [Halorubraceae archaeon YAN]
MDAHQRQFSNPFSMDTACTNCAELCETRETIVHGYGDVAAEFLFIGEHPTAAAEETGVPFTGDDAGERLQYILGELGFVRSEPTATEPDIQNAFLTYLTRCRNPDRAPTDNEIDLCEPFLNAEIRMINPQMLVPIGDRALKALAMDYTTTNPDSLSVEETHATTVRGRGFELLPMIELDAQSDADTDEFIAHVMESVFSRDYRQTKGRQSR